jgi:hypothetical protein
MALGRIDRFLQILTPAATSAAPLTSPVLNDRNMVSSNEFVFFDQSITAQCWGPPR